MAIQNIISRTRATTTEYQAIIHEKLSIPYLKLEAVISGKLVSANFPEYIHKAGHSFCA